MATTTSNKRKHSEAEIEKELCNSVRDDDFDRTRELVEIQRVNVDCTDEHGRTPLNLAVVIGGRLRTAQLLLDKGANADAVDEDGDPAVSNAVYSGNVAVAQLLLKRDSSVESQIHVNIGAYSLLGWAIYKGNADMVALLLRYGANTEATLYVGKAYSALYLACRVSNAEIVQLLLSHNDGVDVNTITPKRGNLPAMSPLCAVCRRNNLEMVKLLIQNGAQVIFDGDYPESPSPLVRAVEEGPLEIVRLLLDSSQFSELVNENVRFPPTTGDGTHPLSPPLETAIEFDLLQDAQLLVERGANVNDRPFLWQYANYGGRLEIARFLLRAGANVNLAHRESGETPLWKAAKTGHVKLVKELLNARADIRIHNNDGETPLGVAYRQGHKDIVYLLLRTSPHVWSKLEKVW